jgi:hypothetical protein
MGSSPSHAGTERAHPCPHRRTEWNGLTPFPCSHVHAGTGWTALGACTGSRRRTWSSATSYRAPAPVRFFHFRRPIFIPLTPAPGSSVPAESERQAGVLAPTPLHEGIGRSGNGRKRESAEVGIGRSGNRRKWECCAGTGLSCDRRRRASSWHDCRCARLRRDWMGSPPHVCAVTGWANPRLPTSAPGLDGLALCTSAASEYPRGARSTHRGSPDGVLEVLTGYYGVLTGRVLSRWTAEGSAAARRQRCDVGARVRVEYPLSTLVSTPVSTP